MAIPDVHSAVFDSIASDYDAQFTLSRIGKAQRQVVHTYVASLLDGTKSEVLELNCGTGEDAIWLAQNGLRVTCTDISKAMVQMVNSKIAVSAHPERMEAFVAGFHDIHKLPPRSYDLVFSNFGGLNCVEPQDLQQLSSDLLGYTQVGSRLVIVLIGRNCLWEQFYFLATGQWGKAFRRWRGKALARLEQGHHQMTWYPGLRKVRKALGPNWKLRSIQPVGLFVPPSYLEPLMARFPKFFKVLASLDKRFAKVGFAARFSDHYLMDLERIA